MQFARAFGEAIAQRDNDPCEELTELLKTL
jgi:hypothetical protein